MNEPPPSTADEQQPPGQAHPYRRRAWIGGIAVAVLTAVATALATGVVDDLLNPIPVEDTEEYRKYQAQVRDFCDQFTATQESGPPLNASIGPGRTYVFARDDLIDFVETYVSHNSEPYGRLWEIPPHPALADELDLARTRHEAELEVFDRMLQAVREMPARPTWEDTYRRLQQLTVAGLTANTNRAFTALAGADCPGSLYSDEFIRPPESPPACLDSVGIVLTPASGPAGGSITVTGRGFPPGATIEISMGPGRTETTADRDGNFRTRFVIDDFFEPFPGPEHIRAAARSGFCWTKALFTVTG